MKKIQSAFTEAMGIIAADLGLKTEDLNLWVKCAPGNLCLLARTEEKVLTAVPVQKMISRKMLSLQMTVDKLTRFFQCVQVAYVKHAHLQNPDTVSMVLYCSKVAHELCIGICEGNKAKKAYRLSELVQLAENCFEELN